MRSIIRLGRWLMPVLMLWLACATTPPGPSPTEQRQKIKHLIYKIRQNPRSAEAFRDLGTALFEMKWYKFAVKSLIKAWRLNRKDAQTLYYLAQLLELRGQTDRALMIYGRYKSVEIPAEYKYKMEAQHNLLSRTNSRKEIHKMLQSEALLQIKTTSPKTIAVLPLKHMGLDENYAPMGKGVAEMIMTDLSQVKKLDMVERVRVQALYDEMQLSQTGLMDVTSTPKMGKLLGAGKVVQGNFAVLDDRNIHLDVTYTDIFSSTVPNPITMKDRLQHLFKLEKDLVFQVIGQMGIELSARERQQIQHIPTKNIQAFIAYSMGLEMEDQGNFTKAAEYFKQATGIDPGYEEAQNKLMVNQSMAQISRQTPFRSVKHVSVSPRTPLAPTLINREALIRNRLHNVSRNIGSTFIPGQDSRKSSQEFTTAQLLSNVLDERISNPLDLYDFDVESLFNTITLPDLPRPPDPPGP
ncbi:hypothetical protein JW835_01215 [bacterium]|nr:hypothetical protein [bacterium]